MVLSFLPHLIKFSQSWKKERAWLLLLSLVTVHWAGGQSSSREHCCLKATPSVLYGTPVDGSVLSMTPWWPFKGTCDSVVDLIFSFLIAPKCLFS